MTPIIGHKSGPVGGRPNQRSLNLGGFPIQRPTNWRQVVRHEFLHALAFQHEHQSPLGPCEDEFRWQDDAGYQPTMDPSGVYIADSQGRRPGIYTYLGGPPNTWSRATVDHDLRRFAPSSGRAIGPFDRESVMLYRFEPLFYRSDPSPCAPLGQSESLSSGDKRGLEHLYPRDVRAVNLILNNQKSALEALLQAKDVMDETKAALKTSLEIK